MSKIELMAQPASESDASLRESTLQKLQALVEKDVNYSDKEKRTVEVDHDQLEIPEGKIPLDSQFSTEEVKELVELSKEEGILKEDVDVQVSKSNSVYDEVVIAERKDEGEGDGEQGERPT